MSVSEDTNGLWFEHGQLVPRMSKLAATDIDELLGGGIGDCGTPFIVTDATQVGLAKIGRSTGERNLRPHRCETAALLNRRSG